MKLVLPYPPPLNNMYRGRRFLTEGAKAYHNTAYYTAKEAGCTPLSGDLRVTLHIYRPQRSGDLDGAMKCLIDSLKNACWHDDRQIIEIHAYRHDDRDNPRVELEVQEL